MSVDELVQKTVEQLMKSSTHEAMLRQAVSVAVEVHALAHFSDDEKKVIVLDILKQAVQKSALSEEVKKDLSNCLKMAVPATLDIAVSASRGEFSLKKPTVSCFFALFRSCLAAVPLDPKMKEMVSAGVSKAESLAAAVESGESVKAAVAAAVSGEAKDAGVTVAALAEKVAEVVPAAPASPAVQSVASVGSEPSIGILIVAAPPPSPVPVAEVAKDEPPVVVPVAVDDLKDSGKTAAVPDWAP